LSVDVHTHVVPLVLPDLRAADNRFPVIEQDDERLAWVKVNSQRFRRIDSRCWNAVERLQDMDAEGIGLQVLSPMPELLSYWLPAAESAQLADSVNASIAAMCAAHPGRFAGLGMVTLQEPDLARAQLRQLRNSGLAGVEIGTHVCGRPLGSPEFFPVFETMADENLCLFIHPLHPAGCDHIGGAALVAGAAAFPAEIAFAASSLMLAGIPSRLPQLRILLSHGGGALPVVAARLAGISGRSEQVRLHFAEPPMDTLRRFWFDSNVYDPEVLSFLAGKVGGARIVVGSDYPFEICQQKPLEFASKALGRSQHSFLQPALNFLGMEQGAL
jgi:aminocarboxymuconate-semialdehyde decarboxylase